MAGWATSITRALLLLLPFVGCQQEGNERYIPAAPLAREALDAAMVSWIRGEQGAKLSAGKPQIELIDSQRIDRKLKRYEVLGELSIEGGRRFDVRLHLTDPDQVEPDQVETVQYIVLGIDPLWVMQKRDYDVVMHWEMDMDQPQAEKPSIEEQRSEEKSDE